MTPRQNYQQTPSFETEQNLFEEIVQLCKSSDIDIKQFDKVFELVDIDDEIKAKKALAIASAINEQKAQNLIKNGMRWRKVERTERKKSVNGRLTFVDMFSSSATTDDVPFILELLKKDRSPRIRKELAKLLMRLEN